MEKASDQLPGANVTEEPTMDLEINQTGETSLFITNPGTFGNENPGNIGPGYLPILFNSNFPSLNRSIHFSSVSEHLSRSEDQISADLIGENQVGNNLIGENRTKKMHNFYKSLRNEVPISATLSESQINKVDDSVFSDSSNSAASLIIDNQIQYLRQLSNGSEIEFQNSSFANDSDAHFDLDINLEHHKPSRTHDEPSFWLASKSHSPQKLTMGQAHYLNQKNLAKSNANDINGSSRIAELTKQLTDCKIQLRIYEKFLQDLIDSHNVDSSQLELLRRHWSSEPISSSSSVGNLAASDASKGSDKEIADLSLLVEELHANLEECQVKWKDADQRAHSVNRVLMAWSSELPNFLHELGYEGKLDTTIPPENLLEIAVPLLKDRISVVMAQKLASITVENELREKFEKMKISSDSSSSEKINTAAPVTFTNRYNAVLANESDANSTEHSTMGDFLIPTQKEMEDAFKVYQMKIEELQTEVDFLKSASRRDSSSDISTGGTISKEKVDLQKELETLQVAYDELSERFHNEQENSGNTIKSLNQRFQNQKREILGLRSTAANFDNIQRDLEITVDKQRALTSEKIKLSYQVEALQKDKLSLQNTIDNLTDKLRVSGQLNSPKRSINQETPDSVISRKFEDLFACDVHYFQKLLESFNKIAEDKSLADSSHKLDALLPLRAKLLKQPPNTISFALDYHESVFGFFSKAVEVIVRDHIRLLLKQDEEKRNNDTREEKLMKRIKELERLLQDGKGKVQRDNQLRIEELTNRWKAEREARVAENNAAQRRLNELLHENSRLSRAL